MTSDVPVIAVQRSAFARKFTTTVFFLTAVLICLLAAPRSAQACKDCPFPMKVGANEWLMPDSHVVVGIYETEMSSGTYVFVELRDQRTDEIIASGSTMRSKSQRSLSLTLRDQRGHQINAKIHWVSFDNAVIQAKFDCAQLNSCSFFGALFER